MASQEKPHKTPSGSPPAGEPEYLVIGALRRPHGLRGELLMQIITDYPERLKPDAQVFLGKAHTPTLVLSTRQHNEGMLIKFSGIETIEDAGVYRNQLVYAKRANLPPLPKGSYYHHQLVGCQVVAEQDETIGTLTEIMHTGANDVYVITRADGGEVLLPVIPSVVLEVEIERRTIRVRMPRGLAPNGTG